jgi:hypothetical protein
MSNRIIQEVDILQIVQSIGRRSKKLQAVLLQDIEQVVDRNSPEYQELRKKILDETNSYNRSIVRLIFGDIEYIIN